MPASFKLSRAVRAVRTAAAVAGFLATAAFLATPSLSWAGAWTQPRGYAYVRIAGFAMDTPTRFDADGDETGFQTSGNELRPSEYRARDLRLYAEYGVTGRFTVYGSFTYKRLEVEQPSVIYGTHGGGDMYLAGRFGLTKGRIPVSLASEVKFPTGYSEEDYPALGTGAVDIATHALVGGARGPAYGTGSVGYMVRGGGYRDQILYTAEMGSRLAGPFFGRAVLRGIRTVGSMMETAPGAAFDPSTSSPRQNTLDLVIGVSAGNGLGVEAGHTRVLNGREALAGSGWEVAISWSGLLWRPGAPSAGPSP